MVPSVCVKTVFSKLQRQLLKVVLLRNNRKIKCPFKTNVVKMKTIFSLKVAIKVTFPWKKCYSMIIFWTWIMPLFGNHYYCAPIWTCLSPMIWAFQN